MKSESHGAPAADLALRDEIEVNVEKLVAGGDGLARHHGLPVFVARAAPGDRLRVRVSQRKAGYARGEILEVLEAGEGRREPPCRHFADCGGCDLQHLRDDVQVEAKAAATVETIERLGKILVPEPRIIAGDAWGYRMRTQLHSTREREGGGAEVGYYARGSHRIVPVEECPVLVPELEIAARRLPASLGSEPPARIDLAMGDGGALSVAPAAAGLPHGEVRVRVGEFDYGFDARCFFQGHRGLLPQLVEAVVGDHGGSEAIDLYAGVGLFALPLARHYDTVRSVEGDRVATRYARRNARRNGVSNLEVTHQAVESWLPALQSGCDRVVVDPPRTGLSRSVVARVLGARPDRVTYVSCHPAALARDLALLSTGYEFESLALIDLFPQTGHMEAVAQLKARPSDPRS